MPKPKVVLLGVLAAALLLEGAVLYFMETPTLRLYAGLAVFVLIGLMFATTPVVEAIGQIPGEIKQRRYPKMRSHVKALLAEVRRLNWMAVDGKRGFRDQQEAVAEMDAIEARMKELVIEIRREAGVASDEPDPGLEPEPSPDEPSVSDE